MTIVLGRARSVLRKFNSNQLYWEGAVIKQEANGRYTLMTYWKNPELYGLWEFRYFVRKKCMAALIHKKLVEEVGAEKDGVRTFQISTASKQQLE